RSLPRERRPGTERPAIGSATRRTRGLAFVVPRRDVHGLPANDHPYRQALTPTEMRVRHIDGLRALAVLSVLIYHGTTRTPVGRWFVEGRHGVDLFFVISGFCLSHPVLTRLASQGSAAFDNPLFFAKRIARIVPPY